MSLGVGVKETIARYDNCLVCLAHIVTAKACPSSSSCNSVLRQALR